MSRQHCGQERHEAMKAAHAMDPSTSGLIDRGVVGGIHWVHCRCGNTMAMPSVQERPASVSVRL